MARQTMPVLPVKTESRICFGLEWYDTEADAMARGMDVRAKGHTYNGGYFDGMSCGRSRQFDYTDPALGPLFAVTV